MAKRTVKKSVSNPKDRGFAIEDKRSRVRLTDQLGVQKRVQQLKSAAGITEKRRILKEAAFYPAHDKRTESPAYHKVHVDLTETKNLPCLVCGVTYKTLHDPKENTYGAKQMETHHHIVEWAMANAVDVDKFNKILRPHLALRHPQVADYQTPMSRQQILDWVDHSPDNLWVLCDVHHRAMYFGIHEITYPIWCPMDMFAPDFETYVRQEVAKAAAEDKAAKKAKPAKSN